MLGIINRAQSDPSKIRFWSLGDGAACAIQTPPHYLVLGDLNRNQYDELASTVQDLDFLGCIGADGTAEALAAKLTELGVPHELGMPQRIYVLDHKPRYPSCEGKGRKAKPEELGLFLEWFFCFYREAVPHESPNEEHMKKVFADRPVFFWEAEGKPVAMAVRNRETKDGSNISLVFTPSALRGRGYAGAVTAFACDDVFREGKKFCFLYTDLRNPISNRVYQKIGFRPWCDSKTYSRVKNTAS
jgi:predicted GNAT family acetyltransferase